MKIPSRAPPETRGPYLLQVLWVTQRGPVEETPMGGKLSHGGMIVGRMVPKLIIRVIIVSPAPRVFATYVEVKNLRNWTRIILVE